MDLGDVITLTDLIENMEVQGTVIAKITDDNTNETQYLVSVGLIGQVIKVDGEGNLVEG